MSSLRRKLLGKSCHECCFCAGEVVLLSLFCAGNNHPVFASRRSHPSFWRRGNSCCYIILCMTPFPIFIGISSSIIFQCVSLQVGADLQSEPCFAKTKDIMVFSHLFYFSFLSWGTHCKCAPAKGQVVTSFSKTNWIYCIVLLRLLLLLSAVSAKVRITNPHQRWVPANETMGRIYKYLFGAKDVQRPGCCFGF